MIKLKQFERSPRLAELKAVYRSRTRVTERKQIAEPTDVTEYLRAIWNKDTLELNEDFIVLCLNGAHQVIGWVKVSSGGMSFAQVDPRLVFSIALQTASAALIIAHNHPSGNVEPSEEDKRLTTRLKAAGELLGVRVLDHIILSKEAAFSFKENGLM